MTMDFVTNSNRPYLTIQTGGDVSDSVMLLRLLDSLGVCNFCVTGEGYIIARNLPTSPTGLESGTIWNDSGTLKVV